MASCSLATLQEQACANGFLKVTEKQFNAILLVQLANLGANTLTLDELQAQACANKFKAVNEKQFRAAWLQMLCNLTDGLIDCVNLIPAGALYMSDSPFYNVTPLIAGQSYTVTFGENDIALFQGLEEIDSTGPGSSFTFTALGPPNNVQLESFGGLGIPVTAVICEV